MGAGGSKTKESKEISITAPLTDAEKAQQQQKQAELAAEYEQKKKEAQQKKEEAKEIKKTEEQLYLEKEKQAKLIIERKREQEKAMQVAAQARLNAQQNESEEGDAPDINFKTNIDNSKAIETTKKIENSNLARSTRGIVQPSQDA